jgi:hypothetical protein
VPVRWPYREAELPKNRKQLPAVTTAVGRLEAAGAWLDWKTQYQLSSDGQALDKLTAETLGDWDTEMQDRESERAGIPYPPQHMFTPLGEKLLLEGVRTLVRPVKPLNWLNPTKELLKHFAVDLPHCHRLQVSTDTELTEALARFIQVRGKTRKAEALRVTLSRLRNSEPLWKK